MPFRPHTSPTVLCCSWGGLLVAKGLMPLGVLISGLGFTFSLTYATQVRERGDEDEGGRERGRKGGKEGRME